MARPLRIEFPGAVYHVTSRGDRRESIFVDDRDRVLLLDVLAQASERFDAEVLSYCLMGNHYHVVLHTRHANLSLFMRHLNGVFTQGVNRRHDRGGHVFQGRFKAILVDRVEYLLALCRYVELNPVRAHIVKRPQDWPWSSYLSHTGAREAPAWLDTPGLHRYLLGRESASRADHRRACRLYADLVASAPDLQVWPDGLRQQIYLGDEAFVARMQEKIQASARESREIPKSQSRVNKSLGEWLAQAQTREEGLFLAHAEGGLSMTAIGRELGLSVSRVSRLIARWEGAKGKT